VVSCAARCDQIIALIDACLAEIRPADVSPPLVELGSSGLVTADERAKLHWAMAADCPPVPLEAA
jgi:hypothetical protein